MDKETLFKKYKSNANSFYESMMQYIYDCWQYDPIEIRVRKGP